MTADTRSQQQTLILRQTANVLGNFFGFKINNLNVSTVLKTYHLRLILLEKASQKFFSIHN